MTNSTSYIIAMTVIFKLVLNMAELYFIYRHGYKPYVLEPFLVTHLSHFSVAGTVFEQVKYNSMVI